MAVNATPDGARIGLYAMHSQCLTSLWAIYRRDDTVYRSTPLTPELYTSHDQDITVARLFNDAGGPWTFTSARAVSRSASSRKVGTTPETMSFQGVVDGLALADIAEGRYDMARVLEFVVDWRWPYLPPQQKNVYYITSISYTSETYQFEVEGLGRFFRETSGDPFNRPCRYTLGQSGCATNRTGTGGPAGVNIASYTYGATTPVEVLSVDSTKPRRRFTIDTTSGSTVMPIGGFFKYGHVTWQGTSENPYLRAEIRDYEDSTPGGNNSNWVVLQDEMPNDIAVGDQCIIVAGCDRTYATCGDVYSNAENFGGEIHIPGPTRARQPSKVTW